MGTLRIGLASNRGKLSKPPSLSLSVLFLALICLQQQQQSSSYSLASSNQLSVGLPADSLFNNIRIVDPSYLEGADEGEAEQKKATNNNGDNGADDDDDDANQAPSSLSQISAEQLSSLSSPDIVVEDENFQDGFGKHEEIYILEDKDYPKSLFEHYPGVGQVSGITALPSGDVAIFHRADREWNQTTFLANYSVANLNQVQDNLIKNDTIMIIDRENGGSVTTFGSNLFYMPHSIASDNQGNLWVSDVGRHQVMRLPTSMLQLDSGSGEISNNNKRWLPGNLSRLWPDIIIGEAFVPGDDRAHFCQPTDIAISSDGRLVFVADGYCNQRIMVFTGSGKFLASFGEQQGLDIVHSLTLIEERNLICAADRENGRILCFKAGLDGQIEQIGELIININYPLGRVFAITSLSANHMLVSSNQQGTSRYDLAALNPFTSELKQTWTSSDLLVPHSLTKTMDGLFAYAADMSKDAYKKLFKFNIIMRKT